MVKAKLLGRKLVEELAEGGAFGFHAPCIAEEFTWRKGIITEEDTTPVADAILAIPAISNGQALLAAKMDELGFGTSVVRIERVDPADLYVEPDETTPPSKAETVKPLNLGHRIAVNPPA